MGGEGDDKGWDGWMASPTQWTSVWVNSGSWWWTGRLQSIRSQRVRHDWEIELSWWDYSVTFYVTGNKIGKYQSAQLVFRSGSSLLFYFCIFLLQAVELLENSVDWFCRPSFLFFLLWHIYFSFDCSNKECTFFFQVHKNLPTLSGVKP